MLTIWGRNNSINVQKVMWAVGEIGLEHRRIDAGGAFGGMDDPDYRAMNPNGRVPTLEDKGQHFWESNAIVRYLCASYSDGALWPSDPVARSLADRWMDWQAATMVADMTAVFWGLIRTPEAERDWIAIGDAATRVNGNMGLLDRHLAAQEWVAGDTMTMGDIAIGALVYRWANLPMERPDLGNVMAYYSRLKDRPAYAEHVMIPLT